jgi:TolB-like protein/class 3 adenylate cyclase
MRLESAALATERVERKLAAILAADVAGYSRLMGADEEGTLARLKEHRRELIDPKIAEHRGRIVKTTGDGLLVEFASPVEAVRCAGEIQRAMREQEGSLPEDQRIEIRVGINLGDVIIDEDDVYGDGVNIAARLEALADPGGVVVSSAVFEQVRDRVPDSFEDLGDQQVKNIARPVRVYRVRDLGAAAKSPSAPTQSSLPLPDKPSLAVLAFQNMTGDAEQDYFVDGVVEEIITAISRLPWLFVIARNSSFTFKGKAIDVKQVARELGVRYVLEGSVRKAANRVRITGQLIDTMTGAHIWADRFDGLVDDIFALQDQVASNVVGVIEPKLRQSEMERAARKPTDSLDAYDLYLRALAQFHRFTEEGMRYAVALLQRALVIDPSYAPAAALIGFCRHFQRDHGLGGSVSDADVAESMRLARRAIDAGRDDPDALWMAAFILTVFAGEHAIALSAIDRALTLNPNSAHAWHSRGFVLVFSNQPGPAIEALQRAMRLSPLDPLGPGFKSALAGAHFVVGRYEEAVEWADRALHERPDFDPAIGVKVVSCAHLGRIDEAREWLSRRLELQPGLTIAEWKTRVAVRFASPEILALYVEGLRKAGLPEK